MGREIAQHRDYSDETALKIDNEVARLIHTAYKAARKILDENMDLLHKLADLLLEKETVLGNELDDLILEKRPEFDFPSKLDDDLVPDKKADQAAPEKEKPAGETGEGAPDETPAADNDSPANESKE